MKVEPDKLVTLEYQLFNEKGELLEETSVDEPLLFVFGSGMIIPGLEKGLEGMEPGESKEIIVAPEDGYGLHQEELVHRISREHFPEHFEPEAGMFYRAVTDAGNMIQFKVVSIDDTNVEIDLNHPLAGETLHFKVTVTDVKDQEEF
jgi:FKBP-type peptidyl-prolyl cis-trans isomerase SlyD